MKKDGHDKPLKPSNATPVPANLNPAGDVADVIQSQIEEMTGNLREKLVKASRKLKIKNAGDFKRAAEVEIMYREGVNGIKGLVKGGASVNLVYMNGPVTINPKDKEGGEAEG
jgi:hypothetical protein